MTPTKSSSSSSFLFLFFANNRRFLVPQKILFLPFTEASELFELSVSDPRSCSTRSNDIQYLSSIPLRRIYPLRSLFPQTSLNGTRATTGLKRNKRKKRKIVWRIVSKVCVPSLKTARSFGGRVIGQGQSKCRVASLG